MLIRFDVAGEPQIPPELYEMGGVPRVGDEVELTGAAATVMAVVWTPAFVEQDVVVVVAW